MTDESCRRQLVRQPVVPGAWVGGALFLGEGGMMVEFTWGKPLQTDGKSLVLGSAARMKRFCEA